MLRKVSSAALRSPPRRRGGRRRRLRSGVQTSSTLSGAPFVTSRRSRGPSTTTERRRRSKSKGISSVFRKASTPAAGRARMATSSGLLIPVSNWLFRCARKSAPIRRASERIERRVERHRPRGERARLVAAEDVDAAEVLDRREVLHDHLLARHPDRALRERDRRDHRQELRREARRRAPPRRAATGGRRGRALRFTTRMKSTRKSTVCRIRMPKRRVPRSNSVSSGRAARRATMSPNAVRAPVAKTTALPVPLTIDVPRKSRAGAVGTARGRWRRSPRASRRAATRP